MDDTVDSFDYSQMFGSGSAFDGNVGVDPGSYSLPFNTVDTGNGTATVTANNNSPGFFSSLGSSFTGLLGGLTNAATTAAPNLLPALLGNRTDPATAPNPTAAAKAQVPAGAQGSSMTGWIIGGVVGLVAIIALVFTLGRKRKG